MMNISAKLKKQFLYSLIMLIGLMTVHTITGNLYAQDQYPREYTNPDEIVAFDKSTNYTEAIEVINQFLQEYRNKFIIDQTATTGTIGTSLPAMHWEDALGYILRLKRLGIREFDEYIEIVPLSVLEAEANGTTSATAAQTEEGEEDINLSTREIRINATFFEGNRRALQEIGVDWSTLTNNVPANLNQIVAGEGGTPSDGVPQTGTEWDNQFVSVNSFNASSVSQNAFNAIVNLGDIGAGINVQALFSAFESDNLGEVLATPSIKVMDGQEGRIQVGQDFSIKQRDIAGNVTDQFFSTGTILTVTPQLIQTSDTTFIHLQVAVERSSAQPDAVSTIIQKQEAQTQALLLDGEATSIAGLYRTEEASVRRGIPILKDLPPWFFGLRYLFGYNSNDYIENELIIILQAELEESLRDRLTRSLDSRRTILDESRQEFRDGIDKVFDNPYAQDRLDEEEILPVEDEVIEEDTTVVIEVEEVAEEETPVTEEEREEVVQQELTEEQKKLAEELSLPVDNPELMVVVPRAFSLDEYLEQKSNGESVEDESASNLKFFVIGGSFLVKRNADRFHAGLKEQGFDTRILFHPESRFNYVAFRGFSDFDEAVTYLREAQRELNSEAWLFTKPD